MADFRSSPGQVFVPGTGRSFASHQSTNVPKAEHEGFIDEFIDWILDFLGSDDTVG
ncbi:MAG: hypothetical protein KF852_04710 [Saprospiraceae bacterium]|nr:hypothetical protein [Saprospiraceae bacterium]